MTAPVEPWVWVGSLCGHVESTYDTPGYSVGDTEPCVHCGDPQCVATVTAPAPGWLDHVFAAARGERRESSAVPITAKDVGFTLLTTGTVDADGVVRIRVVGGPVAQMTAEREADVRAMASAWTGGTARLPAMISAGDIGPALRDTIATIDVLRAKAAAQAMVIACADAMRAQYGDAVVRPSTTLANYDAARAALDGAP